MAEVDPVTLKLFVENGSAVASLNRYERVANRTFGTVGRGAISLERTLGSLAGVIGGISAVALARSFLQIADTAKTLEAQLRLATSGFGTFAQAQEDVRRIAAQTRSGLKETASLYGNFSRGAKELGADQEAAARATETFSKTLKISGADANQAASATLQFGQALAAGALRGDELNSVLEAAPRLARLLTESMGLPIGKIKELGEQGKLTSQVLLNALTNTKFTEGIDREFSELPVTFNDAMTQIENAAIITFGAFDRGGQFSTALANFITDGSNGFKDLDNSAVEAGIGIRAAIEGLQGSFGPIFDEARRFFEFLSGSAAKIDIGRDIDKSLGQIDAVTNWLANRSYIGQKLNGTRFDIDGTEFQDRYRQSRDAADLRLRRQNGLTPLGGVLGRLSQGSKDAAQPDIPRSAPSSASTKGGKSAANKAAAEARKAEQERLRAIRDEASNAREAAQLQDDILAARAALATATEDVLRYQLDAIESERRQQVADLETQVKLGQLSREEADERILINAELAGLRNDLVRRRAAEATEQQKAARYRDEANTLQVEAQLIDSRTARRDVEMRILDLAYKEEEFAIRRAAANGEIANLDEALANMRRRQVAERESVNRQNESPLERYSRGLNETSVNDRIEGYVVDELQAVQDSIASGLQKVIGTKDPLISGLINLFIEQVIMKPIANALAQAGANGAGGGIGGFISAVGSGVAALFGGARASGGPVTGGKTYLVGEDGPELWRAPGSGTIIPNHELGAAARGMVGASAASPANVMQTVIVKVEANDYFDARVDDRARRVSAPIAARQSNRAAGASYAAGQQSAPGTIHKYNQLKG